MFVWCFLMVFSFEFWLVWYVLKLWIVFCIFDMFNIIWLSFKIVIFFRVLVLLCKLIVVWSCLFYVDIFFLINFIFFMVILFCLFKIFWYFLRVLIWLLYEFKLNLNCKICFVVLFVFMIWFLMFRIVFNLRFFILVEIIDIFWKIFCCKVNIFDKFFVNLWIIFFWFFCVLLIKVEICW